jgi:hypothetical protein
MVRKLFRRVEYVYGYYRFAAASVSAWALGQFLGAQIGSYGSVRTRCLMPSPSSRLPDELAEIEQFIDRVLAIVAGRKP